MSLEGITNDNGFYSEHYLAEVFAKDIGDTVTRWKARAEQAREVATASAGGTALVAETAPAATTPDLRLRDLRTELADTLERLAREPTVAERLAEQRDWTCGLAEALDLPWAPEAREVDDDLVLPLLGELSDAAGKPLLWLLEALPTDAPDADPLTLEVYLRQLTDADTIPLPRPMQGESWQELLAGAVFVRDDAPRWVVLAGLQQWLLLDRTKFGQGRLLRFDWAEILRRRETDTLRATAALLHRESFTLDPDGATQSSLHEALEEKAHKHAYGVSEDLKYALRESIELLGNEAARQLVEKVKTSRQGHLLRRTRARCCGANRRVPALHVPPAVPVLHRGASGARLRPGRRRRLPARLQPRAPPRARARRAGRRDRARGALTCTTRSRGCFV